VQKSYGRENRLKPSAQRGLPQSCQTLPYDNVESRGRQEVRSGREKNTGGALVSDKKGLEKDLAALKPGGQGRRPFRGKRRKRLQGTF